MTLPTTLELAEHTLTQQHPITRRWAADADRIRLLADEHQIDLTLSTDKGLAAARRDRFAPDQPIEQFFNVWEQAGPGLHVMLSMRYENGNPASPFVDVSATTRPLTTESDIAAVADLASRRYATLHPRYLRWWTCQPAYAVPGTGQDKRFLAAPIHELADRPVPGRLSIHQSQNLSNYDRAVAAYRSIDRAYPDHPRQATIESADDLAELQAAGTLYDVLVNGDWSGYVGVEPGHKLGLAGFKIAELILAEHARGNGYGQYLTTLLCRALLAESQRPNAVLIGTIDQHNTGALNAARRAGRYDIGGWITHSLVG